MSEQKKDIRLKRSRMGCFTCRGRKKKCDELLYPVCQNCKKKGLHCEWPEEKHKLNKFFTKIVYAGDEKKEYDDDEKKVRKKRRYDKKDLRWTEKRSDAVRKEKEEVVKQDEEVIPTSVHVPSRKKSYFLEKIALQQDIFEPDPSQYQVQTQKPNIQEDEIVPDDLNLFDIESFDLLYPTFLQNQ